MKQIIFTWITNSNFNVKFHSFLLIKKFLENNDEETQLWILKTCIMLLGRNIQSITWRTFDSVKFMRNCIVELVGIKPEIAYIAIFDKIK